MGVTCNKSEYIESHEISINRPSIRSHQGSNPWDILLHGWMGLSIFHIQDTAIFIRLVWNDKAMKRSFVAFVSFLMIYIKYFYCLSFTIDGIKNWIIIGVQCPHAAKIISVYCLKMDFFISIQFFLCIVHLSGARMKIKPLHITLSLLYSPRF